MEHACEPPVDRVDAAAFLGRRLAGELHRRLSSAALACTRLTVHAITETGQRHSRTWRCAEPLTPDATADRIRWQLEGWLTAPAGPDSPLVRLILEPVELVDPGALQHALTGAGLPAERIGLGDRARRALVRVQGLLGGDAVRVPVPAGGRGPAERVALVTYGDEPASPDRAAAPWPDALSRPLPALLTASDAELVDAAGEPVTVTARGAFSAEPVRARADGRWYGIGWWAGPWPFALEGELPRGDRVAARAQVLLAAGDDGRAPALLLCYREARWRVEGVYE